eukprot:GGOE01014148.1.p1 GENE.GGOE01014148.1~~GGOE01014148.1.p1  ORF type:complete len:403 (+),score=123.27 GGOE01014148.1:91-1299(+)
MENYTKVRNVGKGGMGQCILVRHNTTGAQYIMKLVDLSKMNRKERNASLHEAKVLSSLDHPNVIRYHDSFLSKRGDQLCIVMEWAEGGDLAAKVKQRRMFSEEQIVDWLLQICLAVRFCHSKRVFHRDIKTQNIFLTADGVVKLGDFGISRVLANTCDNAHTFVGTPYYLSPELVQEQPYNTPSDMWAIGVVLYELMSLRMPFNAMDMKGLMYKIMRVLYDPPPLSYSSELRSLVSKLLVKDPRNRLTAAEMLGQPILQRRLQAFIDGPPPSSVPASYVQALLADDVVEPLDDVRSAPVSVHERRRSSPGARKRSSSLPYVQPAVQSAPPPKPLLQRPPVVMRHDPLALPGGIDDPPPNPGKLPAIGLRGPLSSPAVPPVAEKAGVRPSYYHVPYRRNFLNV